MILVGFRGDKLIMLAMMQYVNVFVGFRGDNVGLALERLHPVSRACHARLPEGMLDHEKQFKRSSLVGPVQVCG